MSWTCTWTSRSVPIERAIQTPIQTPNRSDPIRPETHCLKNPLPSRNSCWMFPDLKLLLMWISSKAYLSTTIYLSIHYRSGLGWLVSTDRPGDRRSSRSSNRGGGQRGRSMLFIFTSDCRCPVTPQMARCVKIRRPSGLGFVTSSQVFTMRSWGGCHAPGSVNTWGSTTPTPRTSRVRFSAKPREIRVSTERDRRSGSERRVYQRLTGLS